MYLMVCYNWKGVCHRLSKTQLKDQTSKRCQRSPNASEFIRTGSTASLRPSMSEIFGKFEILENLDKKKESENCGCRRSGSKVLIHYRFRGTLAF